MGAWGTKVFEDDLSFDWYDEFCESDQSIEKLENAFEDVIETEDYLDHEFGIAALVSAELLAAALGAPSEDFPKEDYHQGEDGDDPLPLLNLGRIREDIDAELVEKARKAVKKVGHFSHSEIRELWEESDSYEEWLRTLSELIERLKM
ncbi:DUF4259 domain-containing protein [Rapidithrix thailandica]|uniref:DUF4259 domain-containing protein n=1 Tax=Rapidithrix thailandica TaxID=413964 RepID=A0AAW9S358_9BACT